MLWLDQKYAKMIPLKGFVEKRSPKAIFNFRCHVCGDSKHKSSLKRGWFIINTDHLTYFCHNCGYSSTLSYFLKTYFPYLYEEYRKEILENKCNVGVTRNITEPLSVDSADDLFATDNKFLNLQQIKDLPSNHKAVRYIQSRRLPSKFGEYYYADNFYNWCKEKQPDNFAHEYKSDARIIIPFRDKEGNIFALNGRALDGQTPKYLTVKYDESKPKVYGLDTIDENRTILVTEGPIDAHFLPNAIACGGGLGSLPDIVKYLNIPIIQFIVITDNEPRNPQTCNFIRKLIDEGFRVVIWPDNMRGKDINDLVLQGKTRRDILQTIVDNVYQGFRARVRLAEWRKNNGQQRR